METIYILYIIIGTLTLSNIFFIYRGTQLIRQVEDAINEMDVQNEITISTLEKMLEEKGVSKVWVIKRERWKE